MEEIVKEDLISLIAEKNVQFVYFYTKLCGTCELAEKMLNIAMETDPRFKISKCNINYIGDLAEKWEIESVPCLCVFQDNKLLKKVYAFQSVPHIYHLLLEHS